MTVRGIEAIKLYIPPTNVNSKIDLNIHEEKGQETSVQNTTMTSVERYRIEWNNLLKELDENPANIQTKAFNGELKFSKFRSIYWAVLLRVLNTDHRTWKEQRNQQRLRYDKLKYEFVKNPHEIKEPDDNPLSQSLQSVWNQYFNDQELLAVIRQDVIRTFPGVDFFRKQQIQNAMTSILFYYAREHPYMCYRQGMHEILAPLLFVIYGDQQSCMHFKEIENESINDTLLNVLNSDYLEADCYSTFSRIMGSIESYYRISNLKQSQNGYIHPQIPSPSDMPKPSNGVEIISQLNSIREKILAKEDLHLHNYLKKLDIPLHLFGIRWLRLLFGREFPLLDLLMLWDAIFADSDRFELPNYILVAMLIRIRDKLLLSDYTTCLTYLMRYPNNVDIHLILRHALHMQMPKRFQRPENAIVYFTMNPNDSNTNVEQQKHQNQKNIPDAPQSSQSTRSRSKSENEIAKVERQILVLQQQNAAKLRMIRNIDNTNEVMDGLSENSPELTYLKLQNAQIIIDVTRKKLQSYANIIRNNIDYSKLDDLTMALDGMDELCSFLDVKLLPRAFGPVDIALEANEQQRQQSVEKSPNLITVPEKGLNNSTFDETGNKEEHFQTLTKDTKSISTKVATFYQKPDSLLKKSARIPGPKKEIELLTIATDERVNIPMNANLIDKSDLPSIDPLRKHSQ